MFFIVQLKNDQRNRKRFNEKCIAKVVQSLFLLGKHFFSRISSTIKGVNVLIHDFGI